MIEHCISSFKNKKQNEAYKIYMSDSIYAITNGMYRYFGAKEDKITTRYYDMINPIVEKKIESEDEVIARIRKKLGA